MGNPFCHMEQLSAPTTSTPRRSSTRRSSTGSSLDDASMGYTMISTGGKGIGGGMMKKMMPEQPTSWLVYAQVNSVKKTVSKAEKAGAKVVVPYQPIGEMGAIGIFVESDWRRLRRVGGLEEGSREEGVCEVCRGRRRSPRRRRSERKRAGVHDWIANRAPCVVVT